MLIHSNLEKFHKLGSTVSPKRTKKPSITLNIKSSSDQSILSPSSNFKKIEEKYRNSQLIGRKKATTQMKASLSSQNLRGVSDKFSTPKRESTRKKIENFAPVLQEKKISEILSATISKLDNDHRNDDYDMKSEKRRDSEVTVAFEDIQGIDEFDKYKIPISDYSGSYQCKTPLNGNRSRAASIGHMSSPKKTKTVANQVFHQAVQASPLSQQKRSHKQIDEPQLGTNCSASNSLNFEYGKQSFKYSIPALSKIGEGVPLSKFPQKTDRSQSIQDVESYNMNASIVLGSAHKRNIGSSRQQSSTLETQKHSQKPLKQKKTPTLVRISLEPTENNQKQQKMQIKKQFRDYNKSTRTRPSRLNSIPSNQDLASALSSNFQTLCDDSTSGISLNSTIIRNEVTEQDLRIKTPPVLEASQKKMTQRRPSIDGGNGLKSSDFTPLNRSRDSKINMEDSFFNKGGLETPCRSHICLDSRKPKNFISNLSFISLNFEHLCNRFIAAVLFENFAIPLSISQKEEVVRAQAQQRLESNSYCLYPSSYSSQQN